MMMKWWIGIIALVNVTFANSIREVYPSDKSVVVFQKNIEIVFTEKKGQEGAYLTPEESSLIELQPSVDCKWRWLRAHVLSCEYTRTDSLEPNQQYHLTVKKGFYALTEDTHSVFFTQLVQANRPYFHEWQNFNQPSWLINFNHPTDKAYVESTIFILTEEGRYEPIRASFSPYVETSETNTKDFLIMPQQPLMNGKVVKIVQKNPFNETYQALLNFYTLPTNIEIRGINCNDSEGKTNHYEGVEAQCVKHSSLEIQLSAFMQSSGLGNYLTLTNQATGATYKANITPQQSLNDYNQQGYYTYELTYPSTLASGKYTLTLYNNQPSLIRRILNQLRITRSSVSDDFGRHIVTNQQFNLTLTPPEPQFYLEPRNATVFMNVDDPKQQLQFKTLNVETLKLQLQGMTATKNFEWNKELKLKPSNGFKTVSPNLYELLGATGVVQGKATLSNSEQVVSFSAHLTRLHTSLMLGKNNSLLMVTQLKDAQPLNEAVVEVRLVDYATPPLLPMVNAAPLLFTTKTNDKGLAILPGYAELDPKKLLTNHYDLLNKLLMITVKKGNEVAFLPLVRELKQNSVNLNPENPLGATTLINQSTFLAGDDLLFQVLIHNKTITQLNLELWGPSEKGGERLYQSWKQLTLNDWGAIEGGYHFSDNALKGRYRLVATTQVNEMSNTLATRRNGQVNLSTEPIKVELANLELNGKKEDNFYIDAQLNANAINENLLDYRLKATYYSGEGYPDLTNARLQVVAKPRDIVIDRQSGRFVVSNDSKTTIQYDSDIALNAKGELYTQLQLPYPNMIFGTYVATVVGLDGNNRSRSKEVELDFANVDNLIAFKEQSYKAGLEQVVELMVIDTKDSNRVISNKAVKVNVYAINSEVKTQTTPEGIRFNTTTNSKLLLMNAGCKAITNDDGIAKCKVQLPAKGTYELEALAKDTYDRDTRTVTTIATSEEEEERRNLSITTPKTIYAVGTLVPYSIEYPYNSGKALIVVEREGAIVDYWQVDIKQAKTLVNIPVKATYGKQFTLTVYAAHSEQGYMQHSQGSRVIEVAAKEAAIEVKGLKQKYRPNETVNFRFKTNLKDARFTVIVVDRAVGEGLPSLLNQEVSFPIETYTNLKGFIQESTIPTPRMMRSVESVVTRTELSNNLSTAWFKTNLMSNEEGEVEVNFKLPSQLTQWKLHIIGYNQDRSLVEHTEDFLSELPYEARFNIPKRWVVGDEVQIDANIRNNLTEAANLKVKIWLVVNYSKILLNESSLTVGALSNIAKNYVIKATEMNVNSLTQAELIFELVGEKELIENKLPFWLEPKETQLRERYRLLLSPFEKYTYLANEDSMSQRLLWKLSGNNLLDSVTALNFYNVDYAAFMESYGWKLLLNSLTINNYLALNDGSYALRLRALKEAFLTYWSDYVTPKGGIKTKPQASEANINLTLATYEAISKREFVDNNYPLLTKTRDFLKGFVLGEQDKDLMSANNVIDNNSLALLKLRVAYHLGLEVPSIAKEGLTTTQKTILRVLEALIAIRNQQPVNIQALMVDMDNASVNTDESYYLNPNHSVPRGAYEMDYLVLNGYWLGLLLSISDKTRIEKDKIHKLAYYVEQQLRYRFEYCGHNCADVWFFVPILEQYRALYDQSSKLEASLALNNSFPFNYNENKSVEGAITLKPNVVSKLEIVNKNNKSLWVNLEEWKQALNNNRTQLLNMQTYYREFDGKAWVALNGSSLARGTWLRVDIVLDALQDQYDVVLESNITGGFALQELGATVPPAPTLLNYPVMSSTMNNTTVRAYMPYVKAGKYLLYYYIQANQKGGFHLKPARAFSLNSNNEVKIGNLSYFTIR